ncbi:MAG: UDP-N-acetylmuramate--L-alanine ligase [Candidatus Omnitrophica bacterium]|nr:UDP-N-acetylmuramate--L-alanine ligase [Candidatus Omnitrophota bacterium]
MDKHYHLVGIGGIGMSGIAQLLLRSGCKVSGSDLKENKITDQLKTQGARIFIGHNPKNIEGAGAVVYSTAIKEDNPEIREARSKGIPLVRRAEALAELMRDKTVITVSGSHGKTTTTSLVSCLLFEAGLMPTVAIGGVLRNIGSNAKWGEGKFFVAEADESDGSFLCYRPKYSIITNIDREHLDYYKEFDKEVQAFRDFLAQTSTDGCVFCCADDPNLKKITLDYKNKRVFFGLNKGADIYAKNILANGLNSEFDCFVRDKFIGRFSLILAGRHNISNALSVIALGLELGIDTEVIKKALAGCKGARRRMEIKFNREEFLVIDDYAHHPTEISATLEAVKGLGKKRVVAIFQPHRYSRTKLLKEEFGRCFKDTDYVVITDIYAASESPLEGVTSLVICEEIKKNFPTKEVRYLPKSEILTGMNKILRAGDVVITLGAGDITKISDELAEGLDKK